MKIIRQLVSILSCLLVCAVVAMAVLLVGVRLIGLAPYKVLSGSMEPTYPVGSMIYVRGIDADEISVGMPLTFRTSGGVVATHRVVEITELDGSVAYITQGDANAHPDPPVVYAAVVGSPVFCIPHLGYVSTWIQSEAGVIAGVALIALLLLCAVLTELLQRERTPTRP